MTVKNKDDWVERAVILINGGYFAMIRNYLWWPRAFENVLLHMYAISK